MQSKTTETTSTTSTLRLALGTGVLSLSALMVGCTSFGGGMGGSSAPTPAPRPVQVCNAQSAQSFVGKSNTAANLEAARKQSGAYMARVLRENQPTTREYNQERLNLITNEAGQIIAVRCG